jgi:hypothetical protein
MKASSDGATRVFDQAMRALTRFERTTKATEGAEPESPQQGYGEDPLQVFQRLGIDFRQFRGATDAQRVILARQAYEAQTAAASHVQLTRTSNDGSAGFYSVIEQAPKGPPAQSVQADYVRAMAEALDADPARARLAVAALVHEQAALSRIDLGKDKHEQSPADARAIEEVGMSLVRGTPFEGLRYTVGAFALRALREPEGAQFFKNLPGWVGRWTDGTRDLMRFLTPPSADRASPQPKAVPPGANYVRAMSEALDADPARARLAVASLLQRADDLSRLDPKRPRDQQSPHEIRAIEEVGMSLVTGTAFEGLRYTVGAFALQALREPEGAQFFKNLPSWVAMWTDGTRDLKKFLVASAGE